MKWNWERADWPNFTFDLNVLNVYEKDFLLKAGELYGIFQSLEENDRSNLLIQLLSDEAIKTSEIENEFLNRNSVQSSIRKHFGLQVKNSKAMPAEKGIAELMVDLYKNFDKSLSHKLLLSWHKMLMQGSENIKNVGRYRTHYEPMQVVSGAIHNPKIHFEAPPSEKVLFEMNQFIKWHKDSKLNAIAKSGIVHLYFVSIHPFEDGNGRIARALSEKTLAMSLGSASMIALSNTILAHRKKYYQELERANKKNEVTDWLVYFAEVVLDSISQTKNRINFILFKTRFFDQYGAQLNLRQIKVIEKIFDAGPDGFKGGMSAEKYLNITKASRATVTRDLQRLVEIGALERTGELKHTRYWIRKK